MGLTEDTDDDVRDVCGRQVALSLPSAEICSCVRACVRASVRSCEYHPYKSENEHGDPPFLLRHSKEELKIGRFTEGIFEIRFFLGWQPQFYQNIRKPFCRHRAFQSELGADFLRIGKLRSRSFRCMWFHHVIRNIASRNCKTLSCTRKHPIGHRLAKNAFSIAFYAFCGSGKLLKISHKDWSI